MSEIPEDYRDGYAKARLLDPALADRYIAHTAFGDPAADALILALKPWPIEQGMDWIQRGIEGGPAALGDAPEVVRAFFEEAEQVPEWFDPEGVLPGCRAFHRHSEMFIGAFVGAILIEGFSTLISRSFSITGRLLDQGVRRLKQNNRHLVEVFLPGGLDRNADGWKLSVRIRLMHAHVRRLLQESEDWSPDWGLPISAAHIAFATASFSAQLLKRAGMLGVRLTTRERESFMMIWRYTGHLMGVAPEMLFRTEEDALHLVRIARICEPPPSVDSILLANGLINSAPIVAGITGPEARRKLTRKIYRISRALIGNELADQLHYPAGGTFGALTALRWSGRLGNIAQKFFPAFARNRRKDQFLQMLNVSFYAPEGLRYQLPAHLHAEKDRPHHP